MTELACQVDPRFVASRLEAGEGKSYSVDTVERVRELGEQPYFIIGADAFAEITSWHRWQDLVRLTEFIVVTRPGHQYATPPGARVHRLETVALPVSSSEIRQKAGCRRDSRRICRRPWAVIYPSGSCINPRRDAWKRVAFKSILQPPFTKL